MLTNTMLFRCILSLYLMIYLSLGNNIEGDEGTDITNNCELSFGKNSPMGTVEMLYRKEQICMWHLTNDEGAFLKLTSTKFSVDCKFAYVEITEDGGEGEKPSSVRICGQDPVNYISTGPQVDIKFVSTSTHEDEGFRIEYERLETANLDNSKCNSSIRAEPNGEIQGPDVVQYDDCFYRIQCAEDEKDVVLELKQLDFGSNPCEDECVFIYNGLTTRNEIGRIDMDSAIGVLNFRTKLMFIRYTRKVRATGLRFRIAYRCATPYFIKLTFT